MDLTILRLQYWSLHQLAKHLILCGGHMTNNTRNRTQVNYSITVKLVHIYAMPRRKMAILVTTLELNK